ncbi:MAG: hypothetical protein AMS25_13880 [Gemmatimonas sp. SM23_52]|nr:MAG: hypothetical protein AMS25_13880 [Gemmatimonas sp. SM23_52]
MCRSSLPLHSPLAVFGKLQASIVALPFAILLLAAPATSQIVAGRVVDASSNEPVGGVTITLVDTLAATHRAVVSNAAGDFIIAITAPGTYLLRASRLGYATTQTPAIEIGDGEVVEVEVRLDVEAIELEPLTVVVRRRETRRERDLREYYERVEHYGEPHLGSAQIYTRESLEEWDAFSLEDAFRFYLRWRPNGWSCDPKVFLDGQQLYGPFLEDLKFMSLSNLEGIELYAGGGPVQGRFWDPDGCGVVLLWTRPLPEGGSRLGLTELLALAGAAALLTLQAALLVF